MPTEIKDIFGVRANSARSIQRLYKNRGLLSASKALDHVIEKSYSIADLDVSAEVWHDEIATTIGTIKIEKLRKLKHKIFIFDNFTETLDAD